MENGQRVFSQGGYRCLPFKFYVPRSLVDIAFNLAKADDLPLILGYG